MYSLARLNIVTHEFAEGLFGFGGIIDGDTNHLAGFRIHSGFPKLLGIHFAQAFIALERIADLELKVLLEFFKLGIVIGVIGIAL
jgi:hypothetical protein